MPLLKYTALVERVNLILARTYPIPTTFNNISNLSHFYVRPDDVARHLSFRFNIQGIISTGEYKDWRITEIIATRIIPFQEYLVAYTSILNPMQSPLIDPVKFLDIIHAYCLIAELHIVGFTLKRKTQTERILAEYGTKPAIQSIIPSESRYFKNAANHFWLPSFEVNGNEAMLKRELDRLFLHRDEYDTIHFHLDGNDGGDLVPAHLILRCLVGTREPWMKHIRKLSKGGHEFKWDCWNEDAEDAGHYSTVMQMNLSASHIYSTKYKGKVVIHASNDNASAAWFFITYLIYAFGGPIDRFTRTKYGQKYKFGRLRNSDGQLTLIGTSATTSGDGNAVWTTISGGVKIRCPTEQFVESSIRACDWNRYWTE